VIERDFKETQMHLEERKAVVEKFLETEVRKLLMVPMDFDKRVSFLGDYIDFLFIHDGKTEYKHAGRVWSLYTAESLLGEAQFDSIVNPLCRLLRSYKESLADIFVNNNTVDAKGKPFSLLNLHNALGIGEAGGDILFLHVERKTISVWCFHHEGGDVKKLATSFSAWLKKSNHSDKAY